MRENRAVWLERVTRWSASGLGAREFAAQEQCNQKSLELWRWRLGMGPRARKRRLPVHVSKPKPARFVEVLPSNVIDTVSRPAEPTATSPFEVTLPNGSRVIVPARFERRSLESIVDLLGGR